MTPSQKAIDIIKKWEGCKLTAYQCSAGRWTIGFGSTMYQDGTKVKQGDKISKEKAEELLMWEVSRKSAMIKANMSQNQFDALCSFSYNVGIGALLDSILYKKVRLNPNDKTIKDEFLRWNRVKGKVIDGLTNRRIDEAKLYFS
jgi:lysozyme